MKMEEDEEYLNLNEKTGIEEFEVDKGENHQKLNQEVVTEQSNSHPQKDVSLDKNRTLSSDVVKSLETDVEDIKKCLQKLSKFHIRSRQFSLFYKNNASELKDGNNMEKYDSVSSKEILECSTEQQFNPFSFNETLECNNEEQSTPISSEETLECSNEQQTNPVSSNETVECKNEEQSTLYSSEETLECSNAKQLNPVSANDTSECSNRKQCNPASPEEIVESRNDNESHPSNEILKYDNCNKKQLNSVSAKETLERKGCHGKQTDQLLASIAELSQKMEKMKRSLQSRAAKTYKNNSRSNSKEFDNVNSKEIPSHSSPKEHLKIAGLVDTNTNKAKNDELVPPTTGNKSNTTDPKKVIGDRRIQKYHRGNTHYSVFHKNNVPNTKAKTFQWKISNMKQYNNPQSPASVKAFEVRGRIKDFLRKHAKNNYNVFRSYEHVSKLLNMSERSNEKRPSPEAKLCIEIDPKETSEGKRKVIVTEEEHLDENMKMRKKQRHGSPQSKSSKRYIEIPARENYESESENDYQEYHTTKCGKRRKVSRDKNLKVTSRNTGRRYSTGYTDSDFETSSVGSYVSDRWRKGKSRFEGRKIKHKKTCKKRIRESSPSPSHKRFRRSLSPDYHREYEDEYSGCKRERGQRHKISQNPERNAALKNAILRYTDNSRKHPPIKSYITDTSGAKYRAPGPSSSTKSYISDRREDSKSRKHVEAGGKFPKNEYDTRSETEMPESVPSTSYKHFLESQDKKHPGIDKDHKTSDHMMDDKKTQKISQRVSVRNVIPLKNAILRYTNNSRRQSCIQPVPLASVESHSADAKKIAIKSTVKEEIVSEDKDVGRREDRIVESAPSTSKSGVTEKVMNEIIEMLVENCQKMKVEPESPPKVREQFDLRNILNKKKEKNQNTTVSGQY